jgi:spore germination cell wall hydrolase CwlJ-like protein
MKYVFTIFALCLLQCNKIHAHYSEHDIRLIAKVVYAEAGYDLVDAYKVTEVVLNRYNYWQTKYHYKSIGSVVTQKSQFYGYKSRAFRTVKKADLDVRIAIVKEVLDENYSSKLSSNCLYFLNPKICKNWCKKRKKLVSVSKNNHHYYM